MCLPTVALISDIVINQSPSYSVYLPELGGCSSCLVVVFVGRCSFVCLLLSGSVCVCMEFVIALREKEEGISSVSDVRIGK